MTYDGRPARPTDHTPCRQPPSPTRCSSRRVFQVRAQRPVCPALAARPAALPRPMVPSGRKSRRAERLGASIARHLASKVDVAELAHLEQLETRSSPSATHAARARHRLPGSRPGRSAPAAAAGHGLAPAGSAVAPYRVRPRLHRRVGPERLRAKLSYTSIAFALARRRSPSPSCRGVYAPRSAMQVSGDQPATGAAATRCGVIEATGERRAPGPTEDVQPRGSASPAAEVWVTDAAATLRPRSLAGGGRHA